MPFQLMDVNKEYEKDPKLKKEDIKALSKWLNKQPHLPKATELQLILFLQSCYYRLEPTKKAINSFFTIRTLCPNIFTARSAETLKYQRSVLSINILPKKTPEGYTVLMCKFLDTDPDHYEHFNQMYSADATILLNLHQNGTSNGFLTVMDMKGLSLEHLIQVNLTAMKNHLMYIQEAVPLRIKGIHCFNVVPFIDSVMALVRPFMKKELLEMINFHTDSMESLYKFIPKEIMPEDYGGEAPSLAVLDEQTEKNLLENIDFFKWLDSQKVDENKRPEKSKDVFSVGGTFKKLEVD